MAFFENVKSTVVDWLHNLIDTSSISADATSSTSESLETKQQQLAIRDLAIYTTVGLLADMISKCERQVIGPDGVAVRDDKGGLWYHWNISPNENQSGAEMMSRIVFDMYYKGAALVIPLKTKLYNVDSYAVDEYPVKGDVYSGINVGVLQVKQKFRADELYVFRGNNNVKNLLDAAFDPYAYLLLSAATSYQRGSGEKYTYTMNQLPSQEDPKYKAYMDNVKQSLQPFMNSSTAVLPLTKDKKLERVSAGNTNSSSSDYTNLRKEVYSMVAAALHIPVGLLDGNITSVDQVVNQTLTFAVDPLASKISNELTRKSFTPEEVMAGNRMVVDTSRIRHMDLTELASVTDKLIADGTHCVDENRGLLGEAPLNTEWSQMHFITKNYSSTNDTNTLEGGETSE